MREAYINHTRFFSSHHFRLTRLLSDKFKSVFSRKTKYIVMRKSGIFGGFFYKKMAYTIFFLRETDLSMHTKQPLGIFFFSTFVRK